MLFLENALKNVFIDVYRSMPYSYFRAGGGGGGGDIIDMNLITLSIKQ